MTMRTTTKTVTFRRPFYLKGVDRLLPPEDYRVVTDEELIEGLSFPAYRRVSTVIFVPAELASLSVHRGLEIQGIDRHHLNCGSRLRRHEDNSRYPTVSGKR